MLYEKELDRLYPRVSEAVRELFKAAFKNQLHENDLFLVIENGHFKEGISKRFSPFAMGEESQHYAEMTQYDFYNTYRYNNLSLEDRLTVLNEIKKSPSNEKQYSLGTQLELIIYLKLWESNRILERLYKLTQLCLGQKYDWYYTITKDDKRQKIIREDIRDKIRAVCPKFYQLIKDIYLSQIRNAVAHSQFFIVGTGINFLNYDPKNHAPLNYLNIEDWEERFHLLALMYNEYIRCLNVNKYLYTRKARNKHFGLEIVIEKKDGTKQTTWYKYLSDKKRWQWYSNWDKIRS